MIMIFTSIAAAALAAVTGMTTIRTPGGIQTTFQEKPDYAIELAVADFSNPKGFYHYVQEAIESIPTPRTPRYSFLTQAEKDAYSAARKTFTTFKNVMEQNGFIPAQMLYYNVYNVEEIGTRLNKRMVDVLDHSVITFVDIEGETISFVDDNVDGFTPEFDLLGGNGAYEINSGAAGTISNSFKVVWEKLSNFHLAKDDYAKAYTKYELMNPGDAWIPEPIWRDLFPQYETFDFDMIGIISSLQKVLTSHSIADEVNILKGRDLSTYEHLVLDNKALAGYSMELALDEMEIASGHAALSQTAVNTAMQEALNLDFGSLMGRNDLNIVY